MQSSILGNICLLLLLPLLLVAQAASVLYCREQGGVNCKFYAGANQCFNLDSAWDNKISSVKQNGGCCAFYSHGGCHDRLFIANPGQIFMTLPAKWNDQASSIKCTDDLKNCGKL
ncbi:hypothetical protein BZA05DRAFT_400627 [Tricharina praecox]|uniref:uncharacterized protein n=1 Tax=Tricharina praecox TaxID=43433 RepID=UPI0022208BB5|nr:uncharacterized protein BZA05DRAFT_400627 [Tricharina praecox]KAI5850016.1 hypothetical protein BZA05DRAFT_400627 [Tricharina praecox]